MTDFKSYSRVYAQIDLDAVEYNIEQMKQNLKEDTKIMAVVKADAYGHGAVKVSHLLEKQDYIWGFAVATLDEAVVLVNKGIEKPVLVLGCIFPDQFPSMLQNKIRMNVYSLDMAESISKSAVEAGRTAYIHIKVDTGMARLGFQVSQESIDIIKYIKTLPNICMEGIFTHFAKADETDKAFTQKQFADYQHMVKQLHQEGIDFKYNHCANSAAIIDLPETDLDIVRAGIAMYGLYPSTEVNKEHVVLHPALELKSHVAFVKIIQAGTSVSYGGTFVAPKAMKIATIPVGYGDGYPRTLSNKGYVLIRGQKAPIIGRVCMDQFMVDVTEIEDVRFGDKVTLIGTDEDEVLPVEILSDLSERFNYEFVCDLGKRIPRVYMKNGEIAEQVDYFM